MKLNIFGKTAVVLISTILVTTSTYAGDKKGVDKKVYSFSIVPQQSAIKTSKVWGPLLKYLTAQTGIKFRLRTNRSIPEFEGYLKDEKYDFSYMNPYHYVTFHSSANYNAVAKAKDKKIKGIMVVLKDSSILRLEELEGKQLAFPSPNAFAASMLPQAYLKQQGIKFTPKYVLSHDAVYTNVARKKYVSGGGVVRTFNNTNKRIKRKLRILWTTKGYTPHAIASHSRVPKEDVKRVQDALISLSESKQGMKVLNGLKLKGFVSAHDADWDDVRALKIGE